MVVTELEALTAAHLRRHNAIADIGECVGAGYEALYAFVAEAGTAPNGPPQAAYRGDFLPGEKLDLDLYLPIPGDLPAQGDISAAYEALYEWVRESGRQPAGASRESYLRGPDVAPRRGFGPCVERRPDDTLEPAGLSANKEEA